MKLKGGTRLKYEKNKEADEKKTGHDPVNLNPATHKKTSKTSETYSGHNRRRRSV